MNAYSLQARNTFTHATKYMCKHIGTHDYAHILHNIHTH